MFTNMKLHCHLFFIYESSALICFLLVKHWIFDLHEKASIWKPLENTIHVSTFSSSVTTKLEYIHMWTNILESAHSEYFENAFRLFIINVWIVHTILFEFRKLSLVEIGFDCLRLIFKIQLVYYIFV